MVANTWAEFAAVFQSMAQARNRWGADAAAMLWGASTVKAILGGLAGEDLREISELAGEYRETVVRWLASMVGT
jgi:type IV secretory pathway TraG/TraD family ATPase VirD4